jgi:L-ascorbate metabolism protein UlaG (beta-lactamase superfamily)
MGRTTSSIGAMIALLTIGACTATPEPTTVRVHYLGHASFLLTFDDSLTVLTDYGASRAWGLDSPVYGLGPVVPHIVTRSHEHLDHAGGTLPDSSGRLLTGDERFEAGGLTVTPIGTHERTLETPDNASFVFEYGGLKILHLGDCQGLMLNLDELGMRDRVRQLYPDGYDLVLLPIGYVSDILAEAAEFLPLLNARRVIPMHFWNPADRDSFLELVDGETDGNGRRYVAVAKTTSELTIGTTDGPADVVEVIGLSPEPAGTR